MKTNSIKFIGLSDFVNMGPLRLRQPFPNSHIDSIDPFILLHHYGPYEISEENNPFDLGPHPHRGFEPVTFLVEGEQWHRDSLGNESVVKSGDVQWTTAGRGIVHAESPTKDFVRQGGIIEGIQLWINLPSVKKLMPANYQHVKNEEFQTVSSQEGKVTIKVVAGNLNEAQGMISTQTAINAFIIEAEATEPYTIPFPKEHQGMIYLLKGNAIVNEEELKLDKNQLIIFNQDGDGFSIKAKEKSKLLFLSGEPIKEKVTAWGPYVMNTQTEIMEAMRDYQMGKMGFLPVS